jgi:potassium transporter
VTGAEALYADLGHFGRRPIQIAWFALVFPALGLNYFGQGALVLSNPAAISDPFFLLVPSWALPGMVLLATLATVIASQAVINGAFSMTRAAIQIGLLPRFEIRHTSETETGQIFLPVINVLLLAGVLILVTEFQSSSALAAAYGIAVSGTMIVTTLLAHRMLHRVWGWHGALTGAVILPIVFIEGAFFAANLLKVPDGGYVPLLLGGIVVVMMWTWKVGTQQLFDRTRTDSVPLEEFIPRIEKGSALRTPGVAVFLTSDASATPLALLHNLKHNGVLHEHIIVVPSKRRTCDSDHWAWQEHGKELRSASGHHSVGLNAWDKRFAWGCSSGFFIPPGYLHRPDDRLTTTVDVHMLYGDLLLSLTAVLIEGRKQCNPSARKFIRHAKIFYPDRRVLTFDCAHTKAFHRGVVDRDELRYQHRLQRIFRCYFSDPGKDSIVGTVRVVKAIARRDRTAGLEQDDFVPIRRTGGADSRQIQFASGGCIDRLVRRLVGAFIFLGLHGPFSFRSS